MANQDLVRYFKEGMASGDSLANLKNNLLDNGWSIEEVNEAYAVSQGVGHNSLVSSFGRGRIFMGFIIFILISIIFVALAFASSDTIDKTLTESQLQEVTRLDLGRDLVEIQFDEVKTQTIRAKKIGVVSTVLYVGEDEYKFMVAEPQVIDLDIDGQKDLNITLYDVKDNSPLFDLKLLEKHE